MEKRAVFTTPYEQYASRNGESFEIIRPVTEEDGWEPESLPAYLIRFQDGTEIEAYPEEIFDKA